MTVETSNTGSISWRPLAGDRIDLHTPPSTATEREHERSRSKRRAAIAYVRNSTDSQRDSLNSQTDAILAFAAENGYDVSHVFQDTGSALHGRALKQNMGLQAAIDHAVIENIPIIVVNVSRLARHAADLASIMTRVKIIPVHAYSAAGGDLLVQGKSAEQDGLRIGRTTKASLKAKRAAGKTQGNPNLAQVTPIANVGVISAADEKAEQIAEVIRPFEENGPLTRAAAIELLERHKVHPRRGGVWTMSSIRRPLKRAREIIKRELELDVELGDDWSVS